MTTKKTEKTDEKTPAQQQPVSASGTAPETPSTVQTEETEESAIAAMQGDLERFKDLAMRSKADFENYRKRATREKEEAVKYANTNFLERLIPVFDNFELGLTAARNGGEGSSILTGMEIVHKQLKDFLNDCGVESIDALGKPFDPNLHEAIGQETSAEVEEGVVVRQIRKGYKIKDRLLRPANVMVSKGKP